MKTDLPGRTAFAARIAQFHVPDLMFTESPRTAPNGCDVRLALARADCVAWCEAPGAGILAGPARAR